MSARIDAYLLSRFYRRMGDVFALVGSVAQLVPQSGERAGWTPVFDGLHELWKRDPRLALSVGDALAPVATSQHAGAALMQLYRFRRRADGQVLK